MLKQKSLFEFADVLIALPSAIQNAIDLLSKAPSEERGAVFTRPEVVEFILDLSGYEVSKPLLSFRILEPSFGNGDFLIPIVDRLIKTVPPESRRDSKVISRLQKCVRGVELHQETFRKTRFKILSRLIEFGFSTPDSTSIVDEWLVSGDFLLSTFEHEFDIVAGNPPYLRQERIPEILLEEYRKRFDTLFDRADLYIPFIEHSLRQLTEGGKLAFICADRWMKNRYGGPLRKLVSESFHLATFANMEGISAFQDEVTAYPAITLISREPRGFTRIANVKSIDAKSLAALAKSLTSPNFSNASNVKQLNNVTNGAEPWLLESSANLEIVRRLEALYPTLEDAGCKVGIGVATGADRVFIGPFESLDVEDSRKLRLAMTKDIATGRVVWTGHGIINPFEDDGSLARMDQYPRFKNYLMKHKGLIAGRHVAKKSPENWYRTIDRIYPDLAGKPKLLIPDIKGKANIVYEPGELYPHHNLYYITSTDWDLRALQTVLQSGIATLFVSSYTTKMRGGYYRFQAQYLRKIRLPEWHTIPIKTKQLLIETCTIANPDACNEAVGILYGISRDEQRLLGWSSNRGAAHDD